VPNVQKKTPDDGQRRCPKHVELYHGINLVNWCVWLVFKKKSIATHGNMNVKLYAHLSVNGSHAAMYHVLNDSLGVAVNRYRHKTS